MFGRKGLKEREEKEKSMPLCIITAGRDCFYPWQWQTLMFFVPGEDTIVLKSLYFRKGLLSSLAAAWQAMACW